MQMLEFVCSWLSLQKVRTHIDSRLVLNLLTPRHSPPPLLDADTFVSRYLFALQKDFNQSFSSATTMHSRKLLQIQQQ